MTHIDRIWPDPASDLSDDDLLAQTRMPEGRRWVRMNFISSLDGAATHEGRSGGLGDPADRRLFDLLRRPADVVLLGAGTARIEGYGGLRLDEPAVRWRRERGMPPHPVLALVSRRLDLDPDSAVFADAPVRPIVCTVPTAPADRREALAEVADLIETGEHDVDPRRLLDELADRGLRHVHSEGGPSLFGSFLDAGVVDALHLTLAPRLEGATTRRITDHGPAAPVGMRLESVLRAGSELLLHYVRE
ncbi:MULTISPECIES: pyrimidine reductase family protein [Microbacterium]|uniref:pyrimidine reductase family protein n=1 Tax=Microbacterium TaxID=33882 RepID=UPI00217E6BDF|nr:MULTISPECIES: pyrimidine reductase family protein [Microbacterium]UWF77796.1 pyrimidine reductase family protein [Microbacterium neungamense]WCM55972.1 pyrimidine reductase family protein [Microbacterium sp. EF45047]